MLAPWVKIIKFIYGDNGGLSADQGVCNFGHPWGNIVSAVNSMRKLNIRWEELCTKRVGNGLGVMAARFPILHELENDKQVLVVDKIKDGRSLRSLVEKAFLGIGDKETNWNSKVPSKVDIFMWQLMLDKLPTRDNLIKKAWISIQPFVRMDNKSMQHLLFDCINVVAIWRFVEKWWSLSLPTNKSLDSMLVGMKEASNDGVVRIVFGAVFYISCHTIWNFKNRCIFDRSPHRKESIPDTILEKSFSWISARIKESDKKPD
ncbi:LOW QUALITY PROTEIN: hypothetical protein OSB04_un000465 [Centaurea solstitialis]|uniref:Reverse transcriptase zinc-binding domain-containing protein n=1 Tax=Centaurea solstitialis TaxID=347529 RepID=A0AA38SCL2_9ASTR|nr:LOW QUALITY PROTEIN: hypothetical protein OSB04_un000465 [Centaurea solstitialis]